MTELTPTKLIAVVVPEDAYDFDFDFDDVRMILSFCQLTEHGQEVFYVRDKDGEIAIFPKDLKPIGTITKASVFDFDAGKYVEDCPHYANMWKNYNSENIHYPLSESCSTPQESFLSLLESNGVYLNNPIEKPIETEEQLWDVPELDSQVVAGRNYDMDKWQSYESKTVPHGSKLLIIEKL